MPNFNASGLWHFHCSTRCSVSAAEARRTTLSGGQHRLPDIVEDERLLARDDAEAAQGAHPGAQPLAQPLLLQRGARRRARPGGPRSGE